MEDSDQSGQTGLSAPGKFDNLLKAFDIKDIQSSEKNDEKALSVSKNTKWKNGSENNVSNVGAGESPFEDTSKSLNTSMTSTASSGSPGRLRIDEGRSHSDLESENTKAGTTAASKVSSSVPKKISPIKKTRSVTARNAKPVPVPVVSIKEEVEDHGYNNAMKNVITMTTPSPIVTTSIPVSNNISLLTGSTVGRSPVSASTPPGRPGAKSLISPSSTSQLKIAPRPSSQVASNPAKFAFIPASTSNPRGPGSKTVTLFVPPNLLTPSGGAGGAIRLPSPQSLMELLTKSGQAITSKPTVRPAMTVQTSQPVNQAGLVNPHPRISSQIAASRQPGPGTSPRMPAPASGPATMSQLGAASRDILIKMLNRERLPSRRITMPPADLNYGTVTKHICACGDEFLYAANLESHIARKSAVIKVVCNFCSPSQSQIFLNPCALVFHINAHQKTVGEFLKGLVSCQVIPIGKKVNTAQIETSTVECIDLSKESEALANNKGKKAPPKPAEPKETIDLDTEDKNCENTEKQTENRTTTRQNCATQDSASPEKQPEGSETVRDEDRITSPLVSATDKESKFDPCPYCKVSLDKGTALEHHFQTAQQCQAEQIQEFICSICNRQLPNHCSYLAHQAFHSKTRPFICPECGQTIHGSLDTYVKHVQDKCMHNMHFLRFGCTKCPKKKKKFSTRKQLLEHIENHGETYVKCLHCPMAFRSMETLKDHCAKTHTITDITETDYKSIFKCALCDTVYQEAEQRRTHLTTHNKDLRVFLVYRCNKMNCGANRIFVTKVRIREHLATAHGLDVVIHLCNFCGQNFDTAEALTEHLKSHSNINECTTCGEVCHDQEGLWNHMTQIHDSNSVPESSETPRARSPMIIRKRTNSDPSTSPAAKRVKSPCYVPSCQVEAAEDSRFYCSDCKLKFLRQGVLQEHMRIVHSVQPQFPCHLCGATYDSHSKLQKHVKQHEGKAREQVLFSCWVCTKNKSLKTSKYTKRSILEKHLTSYHKLNKHQIDWSNLKTNGNKSDGGSEGEGEGMDTETLDNDEPIKRLKVDGDTQFTCAKCTFICENREEFLSHIPQHKTEDESHQCQECGMCFMVLPSLKRHLLVVHRIRDFMKYFQESGLNLETPPVEERIKISTRPKFPVNGNKEKVALDFGDVDIPDDFECKVCYKQFDSEKALHNHMRVHGMAFIRSKRMDSS